MDKAELHAHRQTLRKPNTQDARDKLQQAHGKQYSLFTMMEAQQDVDHLLWEDERKLEPPMQKRPVNTSRNPRKGSPNGTTKNPTGLTTMKSKSAKLLLGATTKMPTGPETGLWWTGRIWLCFASSGAAAAHGRQ